MTLKRLVILMVLATGLFWSGWLWTLLTIDPHVTNWLGFLLFFGTIFFSLVGTLALLGIFVRHCRGGDQVFFYTVSLSFRQSLILSSFIVALLVLQGSRLLRWWNVLLLLAVAIAAEMNLLAKQKRSSTTEVTFEVIEVGTSVSAEPTFVRRGIDEAGNAKF